jgi:regulator of Ty1 transposition protein 109
MVLPGYSADEAKGMLGQRKPLGEGLKWTSDPPFTTPLPTHSSSSSSLGPSSSLGELETPPGAPTRSSLAALIPSLPDDPKARFLDDLVSEGAEDPQRRRQFLKPKPEGGSSSASIQSTSTSSATVTATSPGKKRDPLRSKVKAEDEAERRFTSSTLKRISLGEYWERMGFRQECISGDVTGFFTLESGPPNLIPSGSSSNSAPMQPNTSNTSDPKPTSEALPPGIVDRILQALLNTDFKSFESAIDQSALWDRSVKSIVVDETGEEGYRKCIGVVEGKEGEVVVPVKRKEEAVVTMLQPRKKKKV